MTNSLRKAQIEHAEFLAKIYTTKQLQEFSDTYEDMLHSYYQFSDHQKVVECLENLVECQLAVSMQEQDFPTDWNTRAFAEPIPDYPN